MKALLPASTPSGLNYRKAVLLLLAAATAAVCVLFTPAGAQVAPSAVQAMVKNQPFPYAVGVAMDTLLYGSLKKKLTAADQLRITSEALVNSLYDQIKATRKAMDDQVRLGQHDAEKAASLVTTMNFLQGQMTSAQEDLRVANRAFTDILDKLPRRVRKTLTNPTPDQVATAATEYIDRLNARKWKWAGVSGLAGVGLTLIALLSL